MWPQTDGANNHFLKKKKISKKSQKKFFKKKSSLCRSVGFYVGLSGCFVFLAFLSRFKRVFMLLWALYPLYQCFARVVLKKRQIWQSLYFVWYVVSVLFVCQVVVFCFFCVVTRVCVCMCVCV